MDTKPKMKRIRMLLDDGTLKGVVCMDDDSWQAGELYAAPRDSVDELIKKQEIKKYGVYLLLSDSRVYVGQASDLGSRISQHKLGKSWWDRAIVLTSGDNHFTKTDIDYMEHELIEEAFENGTLDTDNKQKGNKPKIDKFDKASLDNYLEEAHFLLELIGVNVFSKKNTKKNAKPIIPSEPLDEKSMQKISKTEVLDYLEEQGIVINRANCTYARYGETKKLFWLNPHVNLLKKDWTIVLNNQIKKEIILIKVPSNTFQLGEKSKTYKLLVRKDRPTMIDLNIDPDTLVDQRSLCDFSKRTFIERIKY